MKQFKIALAALLAFALVPLFPNNALACASQSSTDPETAHSSDVFAITPRDSDTAAPPMGIHAASPAPTSAFEQPAATKPSNGKSFPKTADTIELLHGAFALTTGVALVIVGVALENNRRN